MISFKAFNIKYLFILIILLLIASALSKGGRGGGGGARAGGGSRFGSSVRSGIRNTGGNTYRSIGTGGSSFRSGGVRWSSFGAGMVAYGLMSNLARRGPYYGYNSYHPQPGYNQHKATGSTCTNNEDFGNGTVFGTFVCPLPEFDSSARYCCGDVEYEYCCRFFDDNSRKIPVILAILAFFGLLVGIIVCVRRIIKRRNDSFKEDYVQPPMNLSNINRNFNQPPFGNNQPRPPFNYNQPRPPFPGSQPRPPFSGNQPRPPFPGNQQPYPTNNFRSPETSPLIQNGENNSLPYPVDKSSMPQPNFTTSLNQPPPSYSELQTKNPVD